MCGFLDSAAHNLAQAIDRWRSCAQDSYGPKSSIKERPEQWDFKPRFTRRVAGRIFWGCANRAQASTEIVYDDGVKQRLIWRVSDGAGDQVISDALQAAVGAQRVLASLV